MEVGIFSILIKGGWAANLAFLLYLLLKFEKRLESFSSEMKKLEEKLEGYYREMVSKEEYFHDVSGWRHELNRFIAKIEELQKYSVSKEEYYKDLSGWRAEIQKLQDQLLKVYEKLLEVQK
jgi:predicted  nucleic acid-binding Zn-ribbon protein